MGTVQSFFPEADQKEIQTAKAHLSEYRKMKRTLAVIQDHHPSLEKARILTENIDRAIALILDDEVRRIIEYRYVKGHSHKLTMLHFTGCGMSERTVDRKLMEGIESVANTLKLCGR